MYKRGYFTLLVLVFAAVFFTLVSALAGFIFVEKKVSLAEENRQKALNIAEAGLEYYKWHLAHYPNDLKDGTNQSGPYAHAYQDPASGTMGTFSLDIQGQKFCGSVNSVTITSTGWTVDDPTYKRTLVATYARPSVADYSTIVDANVWAGADRVIQGPYHSNGGIRMDGTHNAPVTSGVATWICTSQFGCSGNQTKDGVFGAGSNPSLWNFPVPPVDFNGITVDLIHLKGYATSSGGVYLAPSGTYGWYVVFNADGTITARKVTGVTTVWGYSTDNGWLQENTVMASTGSATTYTIPTTCPVVFVEDNIWVEGSVSGKVILAAADVTSANVDRSAIVSGNLVYAHSSGDGLTLLGEKDVLVGLKTPDTMTMRGVFIAQKGKFGRNHYEASGTYGLPASLDPYVTRSVLNTIGTVVSKGRVGTKWTSGSPPVFVSGYAQRYDSFDRTLSAMPPPFTPSTSADFVFKSWQEQ